MPHIWNSGSRSATRKVRQIVSLIPALVLASCTDGPPAHSTPSETQAVTSSSGITVSGTRWITGRTFEADISSALISPEVINGPHRIRVTLPDGYDQNPATRYPVIYLLHGGAGGNSAQWTTGGGAAEYITAGWPVIVVSTEGGKVGWFTNWIDHTTYKQQWADYHLNQIIPWVDANFRTIATNQGRAIGGLSMGGYGAVRLAQDRPDLFTSVGSFSGAVDLSDAGTRIVIWEQSLQSGLPGNGAFGTNEATWQAVNPVKRAANLAGLQVLLYAGSGTSDVDVLERTMGNSTNNLAKALQAASVPYSFWMYGRPNPATSPFGCDGGHDFGCWNMAFNDALPHMVARLQAANLPPLPPGTNVLKNSGFESNQDYWLCSTFDNCGVDEGAGFAHSGGGNGWVRADGGWNDIHQAISVTPNRNYTVTGWIITSANNTAGYFGLRTIDGQVLGEKTFGNLPGYTKLSVVVNSGANNVLTVYGGMWANGDTWIRVDDVTVEGSM